MGLTQKDRVLLFELAGFLTLITRDIHPSNEKEQAAALLDKLGNRIAEDDEEQVREVR